MKIFLIGSKYAFDKMAPVKEGLEQAGHEVMYPAMFDTPWQELEVIKQQSREAHVALKQQLLREQGERVAANDAVLVMNLEKHGQPNYIGGATFLEVFKAWELGKNIFFYNPLPEGMLYDELVGMNPIVINGDLALIK